MDDHQIMYSPDKAQQIENNEERKCKFGSTNLSKKCKNRCVQGNFKTTKEAFSSQLYSTYDFQQKHCKI